MLSIIIPLYNKENYIYKTLKSVMNQMSLEFECIIVDDASTDNSVKIAKDIINSDKRFRLLHNEKNKGVSFSRNKGIVEAKGKYIIFLDADDILIGTNTLSMMIDNMNEYSIDYMITTTIKGSRIRPNFKTHLNNKALFTNIKPNLYLVNNKTKVMIKADRLFFGGSASAILNKSIIKDNKFDEKSTNFEDAPFFYSIYKSNIVYYFEQPIMVVDSTDIKSLSSTRKLKNISKKDFELLPEIYYLYSENPKLKKIRKRQFWIIMIFILNNTKGFSNHFKIWKYSFFLRIKNFSISKFSLFAYLKLIMFWK